jgi:hypothetical protein
MKKIGIVLIAAMLLAGGYFYLTRPTNPLVTGIPPKENSDGTVDYTLLIERPAYEKSEREMITEMVFRFPKVFGAELHTPSKVEISNGMRFDLRSNRTLSFYLDFQTLQPVPPHYMDNRSFNSVADHIVSVSIVASTPRTPSNFENTRWKNDCVETGKKIGNLVEYVSSEKVRSICDLLPTDKKGRLYALSADGSAARANCNADQPACRYMFWLGDLSIHGNIGKINVDNFESLVLSLTKIISLAKVNERTIELSNFSHQEY